MGLTIGVMKYTYSIKPPGLAVEDELSQGVGWL